MAATSGSMALASSPEAIAQPSQPRPHLVTTPAAAPIHTQPIYTEEIKAPEIQTFDIQASEIQAEPITAPADLDLATLQSTMAAALAAVKGQTSASEQIEDATFTLNGATVEIQTALSKTMLPVVLNADADKILKTTLRATNPTFKLTLLPGAPATASAPKKARAAASGSAAELAEKHPVVQQAKQLFSAEISNIIDLRDK